MATTKRKHHNNRDLAADWKKIKNALADAREDASGLAGDWASESVDDLRDRSTKIQKNITHYTDEQPLKALAIAAMVGFVIGYLWKR